MKKALLALSFTMAYAITWSIGIACLLNLLGLAMAISLDGSAVTEQYPRLIPFCLVVGIIALVAVIITFIFNLKASVQFEFTKKLWITEVIFAFVLSLPLLKLWETVFDFLQNTF